MDRRSGTRELPISPYGDRDPEDNQCDPDGTPGRGDEAVGRENADADLEDEREKKVNRG
jgi:hypothetical protein